MTIIFHRKEAFESIILTIERSLTLIAVFAVSISVARYLGPESFGALAVLLSLVSLCTPVSSLGMNAILVREIIANKYCERTIIDTALLFRTVAGLLTWLISSLLAVAFLNFELYSPWLIVLVCSVSAFNGLLVAQFWFQARVSSCRLAPARLAIVASFSILKVYAVCSELQYNWIVILFVSEMIVLAVVQFVVLRAHMKIKIFREFDFNYGIGLLKSSGWLVLSGVAEVIYLKIDVLMLSRMGTLEQTGNYAVASRLSEVWYFIPIIIVTAIFPRLLKYRDSDTKKYSDSLQGLYALLFWLAVFVAVLVSLSSDYVISIFYGSNFESSAAVLSLHVWAGVFVSMRALFSKWLIAEDLLQFSLASHGLGAISNILLNFILIPEYGAIGAAVATLFSYCIASFIALMIWRPTRSSALKMITAPVYPILMLRRA